MQMVNGTQPLAAVSLVARVAMRMRLAVSLMRMRIMRHRTRIRMLVLVLPSEVKYQYQNNMKNVNNIKRMRRAWRSDLTARSPA